MKYQEVKKYISQNLNSFFIEKGFKELKIDTWGFQISREEGSVSFSFGARKLNYGYYIFLETGVGQIRFEEVEMALHELCLKYNISLAESTFRDYDNSESATASRQAASTIKLEDSSSFYTYSQKIKTYCLDYVIPFFEKYKNLKNIFLFIETLSCEDILYYFNGEYPMNAFKSMFIIYKFGNNKKYEELKKYVIGQLEMYKDRNEMGISAFNEFTAKLECGGMK